MKQALILGGGFAGIKTAIKLQKSGEFEVTLVSNRDYLYLNPISIWVPVRQVTFKNTKVPLAKIQKKYPFKVIIDEVEEIKSTENKVVCKNNSLNYDYLVVALGADKMKHKGIENTLSICGKPEISEAIRDELDKLVKKGSGKIAAGFGGNPKDKSAVRGGPAFELIFNIHHYLKKKKMIKNFDFTFFAPMEKPGAKMGSGALKMMDKMFEKLNIGKRFGKKITSFEKGAVLFEDQSKLEADLILFIPASSSHSVLQNSDLTLSESGFVKINEHCKVDNTSNVYAIGDIAAMQGPEWIAKQGHVAEHMGETAAHNILVSYKNKGKLKIYNESPNILCIMDTGNGAAFVYRNSKKAMMIPMPVFGHWLKKAWGIHSKITKMGFWHYLNEA